MAEEERKERLLETGRKNRQTCRKELRLDLNPGCCGKDTDKHLLYLVTSWGRVLQDVS